MRRGNTKQRDYSWRRPDGTPGHRHIKERWRPIVAAGNAHCHARHCKRPSRWIRPGEPWDLGHNETHTQWTGPEHRGCNRSEGATRGNRTRNSSPARATRTW